MKLFHVEQREDWKTASKECRSEFVEAMRNCDYGATETLESWEWFSLGWAACILYRKKPEPTEPQR